MTANLGDAVFVEIAIGAMERRQDFLTIELNAIKIRRYQLKDGGHHVALMRNGATVNLTFNFKVVSSLLFELGISLANILPVTSGNAIHSGDDIE